VEKSILDDMQSFLKTIKSRSPKEKQEFFDQVETIMSGQEKLSVEDLSRVLETLQLSSKTQLLQKDIEE